MYFSWSANFILLSIEILSIDNGYCCCLSALITKNDVFSLK